MYFRLHLPLNLSTIRSSFSLVFYFGADQSFRCGLYCSFSSGAYSSFRTYTTLWTAFDTLRRDFLGDTQSTRGIPLHSLCHEPAPAVRKKSIDVICDFAHQSMRRGRPWHAPQAQVVGMTTQGEGNDTAELRETAFRVFAGCPSLVMDLQTNVAIHTIFQQGLLDRCSIEVCLTGGGTISRAGPHGRQIRPRWPPYNLRAPSHKLLRNTGFSSVILSEYIRPTNYMQLTITQTNESLDLITGRLSLF
jgi:hypothetical protein